MPTARRTRVLIVDDSAVMRSLLRSVISSDPALEVAGGAADGESALGILDSLRPDLILLDVEMPVMDGLSTLRRLRQSGNRMPVIMCSSLTQRGARITIDALAGGASDYVAKPVAQGGVENATEILAQELLPRIHALTSRTLQDPAAPPRHAAQESAGGKPRSALPGCIPEVVVIGVSTGGPAALDVLLPALPSDFPLPILVVQHMPELFTQQLAVRLNQHCLLRVREAVEGDPIRPGTIHIARGNWHLQVLAPSRSGSAATLHLAQTPLENHCRPSVDVLFASAATLFGPGVLAVVLTGMGSDGLAGARLVRAKGGLVLVQDQATSAVWGMPGVVAEAGLAHRVLPLAALAAEVRRLAAPQQSPAASARESSGTGA